jgi:hypothetical protein
MTFSKEEPRMTSQSDDDKYSQDPESHQDDDDLLNDIVLNPNAEGTDEEIIAALGEYDDGPAPSGAIGEAPGTVVASLGSSAAHSVAVAPAPDTRIPLAARSPTTGASRESDDVLRACAPEKSRAQDDVDDEDLLASFAERPKADGTVDVLAMVKDNESAPAAGGTLEHDEIEAIAELDRRDLRNRVAHWRELVSIKKDRDAEKKAKWRAIENATKERIHAKERLERARKLRVRDAERKRTSRSAPDKINAKRLAALKEATASPTGKFFPKLVGREAELVAFRDAMSRAVAMHGPECSNTEVANLASIDRNRAFRLRQIIAKLEAPRGLWARWK